MTDEDRRLAAEAAAYAASDAAYAQYVETVEDDAPLGPPPRPDEALASLEAARPPAGQPVPTALIEDMARLWRAQTDLSGRVALARGLWDGGVFEARIAAAKLLTQARMRPDAEAWALIAGWAEGLDDPALAAPVAAAGGRRLIADLARMDRLEGWVASENALTRRAALAFALPLAKLNHPSAAEAEARKRALRWCARLAEDADGATQMAVAGWLSDLSKHDPAAARDWLAEHGGRFGTAARAQAARRLAKTSGPGAGA